MTLASDIIDTISKDLELVLSDNKEVLIPHLFFLVDDNIRAVPTSIKSLMSVENVVTFTYNPPPPLDLIDQAAFSLDFTIIPVKPSNLKQGQYCAAVELSAAMVHLGTSLPLVYQEFVGPIFEMFKPAAFAIAVSAVYDNADPKIAALAQQEGIEPDFFEETMETVLIQAASIYDNPTFKASSIEIDTMGKLDIGTIKDLDTNIMDRPPELHILAMKELLK